MHASDCSHHTTHMTPHVTNSSHEHAQESWESQSAPGYPWPHLGPTVGLQPVATRYITDSGLNNTQHLWRSPRHQSDTPQAPVRRAHRLSDMPAGHHKYKCQTSPRLHLTSSQGKRRQLQDTSTSFDFTHRGVVLNWHQLQVTLARRNAK